MSLVEDRPKDRPKIKYRIDRRRLEPMIRDRRNASIVEQHKSGATISYLSRNFGLSRTHIVRIVRRASGTP
jgi:hypothetical protein